MRRFAKRLLTGAALTLLVSAVSVYCVIPQVARRVIAGKLADFGLDARVTLSLGLCWRNGPGLEGRLQVLPPDGGWTLLAHFAASACEWAAEAQVPETRVSESLPDIRRLLARLPDGVASNLVFSGTVALEAKAERTFSMPVPVWSVSVPVRDVNASMVTADGRELAISGLSTTVAASGIARHLDLSPVHLRLASMSAAGFDLRDLRATILASERIWRITEASASACGGRVSVYSLVLDPKSLNAGFTMFADGLDAGEALTHIRGFDGTASGRLHGKVRLSVREGGKAIRLNDAFLYSTPGEIGKLCVHEASSVADGLAFAGLDTASRDNLSRVLADLDYRALRLDLRRGEGSSATLALHVDGSATREELTVPVNVTLNITGELNQLLNAGLGFSRKLKGANP